MGTLGKVTRNCLILAALFLLYWATFLRDQLVTAQPKTSKSAQELDAARISEARKKVHQYL